MSEGGVFGCCRIGASLGRPSHRHDSKSCSVCRHAQHNVRHHGGDDDNDDDELDDVGDGDDDDGDDEGPRPWRCTTIRTKTKRG